MHYWEWTASDLSILVQSRPSTNLKFRQTSWDLSTQTNNLMPSPSPFSEQTDPTVFDSSSDVLPRAVEESPLLHWAQHVILTDYFCYFTNATDHFITFGSLHCHQLANDTVFSVKPISTIINTIPRFIPVRNSPAIRLFLQPRIPGCCLTIVADFAFPNVFSSATFYALSPGGRFLSLFLWWCQSPW